MHSSNCSVFNDDGLKNCGFGEFCSAQQCCYDFVFIMLLLIAIFISAVSAGLLLNATLKQKNFEKKLGNIRRRISIIDNSSISNPYDLFLPPKCSPPMRVPPLRLSRRFFR